MPRFLGEVAGDSRPKPRTDGQTMVLDRLGYPAEDTVGLLGDFMDTVKIGWGLPFLVEDSLLRRRIKTFRDKGVHVSNGGTLLEICATKGKVDLALKKLASSGFDTLELSEGVIEIPVPMKKRIVQFAKANGLRLHVEVGRKNPRNQLSLDETARRVEESLDFAPEVVIVEGRESGRSVGVYDDAGQVKWDWVERLEEISQPSKLMFEAPQEIQQTELIIHLGPCVNLGNVGLPSLGALESQRQGLRGETFGVSTGTKKVKGGPASKFLFFVVTSHGASDQSRLMRLTGLNRRTVQEALKNLIRQGLVEETSDPNDQRRRIYSP